MKIFFSKRILSVMTVFTLIIGTLSSAVTVEAARSDMSVPGDIKITASFETGDYSKKHTSLLNNKAAEISPGESATITHVAHYKLDEDGNIEYPEGYIGISLILKTGNENAFYKIRCGNISVSSGVYCNIYDRYGISIGDENGGEQNVPMSGSMNSVLKLDKNTEYIILIYADNGEELAGLSQSRIDVETIPDDVGDSDLDAMPIEFDKLYNQKMEGFDDYDYFSFVTKETDTYYNVFYYNRTIKSPVTFSLYNERNEVLDEFDASNGEAANKTLKLDKGKKYFFRAHINGGDPYSSDTVGDYQIRINAVDDDYPDLNSSASEIKFNTKYMAGIQYDDDRDIVMFNSGNLKKFSMLCSNESTTESLDYVVQSYDEETLVAGSISPGFIGNVVLSSENFLPNTYYYLVFSGKENLDYSFMVSPIKHSIKYELNGGVQNPKNPTSFNETANVKLYEPTRTGFVFDGWYITYNYIIEDDDMGEEPVSSLVADIGNYESDIVLYAKWSSSGYKIFYNLNGGINHSDNPLTFTSNSSNIVLQSPSKVGSIFGGWYTSSDFSESSRIEYIERGTIGNITLYAKWITVSSKITYVLNGGKNNPSNPSAVSSSATLKNPSRKGYVFGGWYRDPGFTGNKTKMVYAVGDVSLYAKWIKAKAGSVTPKLSSKSKKVTVKWKKVKNVSGYQVKYGTKKSMKNAKTISKGSSSVKAVTKKMKAKSKCYVRIRSYVIDSTGKKTYGKWSKIKSIKIR